MKKVLITGISGFVGEYLVEELCKKDDYIIYGTKLESDSINNYRNINVINLDLTNQMEVEKTIDKIKPNLVFHLAAQSSVKKSWDDPNLTVNVNIIGTFNLLESLRKTKCECRILLVGSSEEYGKTFSENSNPLENEICMPQNVYAITKLTQNCIGKLYCDAYNMNIIMTRSFNHFGPKQSTQFVISDFCNQIARIENNLQEPVINVGNLNAYRDFLDVRDVVSIYHELLLKGTIGETYNVGSGKSTKINDLLLQLIAMSNKDIKVEVDKNKFRPIEISEAKANIKKLIDDIGWKQKYDINKTLEDTLMYFRSMY